MTENEKDILSMTIEEQDKFLKQLDTDSLFGLLQMTGAAKHMGFMVGLNNFMRARIFKSIRDSKKYKLAGFKSFDEYCKGVGVSRRKVYELINHLETFGETAYKALVGIGMKETDLRLLKKSNIDIKEKDGIPILEINGEKIMITPESKDEIAELIQKIIKDKNKIEKDKSRAEERVSEMNRENSDLKDKIRKLENPIDDTRLAFQKELADIQLALMGLDSRLLKLFNMAKGDDSRIGDLFATIAWMTRFLQDVYAKYTQEEPPVDEDFFDTSFANIANRVKE